MQVAARGSRRGPRLMHGLSRTPEYHSWRSMMARCNNPNEVAYPSYGGRGIKVCDRWAESFEAFLADMGPRPSPQHTLDRIDASLGYCKENCRWATKAEQQQNKRDTVIGPDQVREIRRLAAEGQMSQQAIGAKFGIKQNTVSGIVARKTWRNVE